jgi:acyl-CoA thioester hydrolase
MTAARLLVHTTQFAIRWGDMDALGHVNNTAYFRYMEEARVGWLQVQTGGSGFDSGHGTVIVNASCNFLTPLVYPADVEVRMYLGPPGRSSVGSYYDILSGGAKCADGAAKIVWIELATGRPSPLPERIVAPLRALAKEA